MCNYSSGVRITPRSYKFSSSAKVGRRIIFLAQPGKNLFFNFSVPRKFRETHFNNITRPASVCVYMNAARKAEDQSAPEGKWYKSLISKFRKQSRVQKANEVGARVCAMVRRERLLLFRSPPDLFQPRRAIYFLTLSFSWKIFDGAARQLFQFTPLPQSTA